MPDLLLKQYPRISCCPTWNYSGTPLIQINLEGEPSG